MLGFTSKAALKDAWNDLHQSEAALRVAREKYRSAQAGWVTTSARLEAALQREERLIAELEEAQTALNVALQACIDREQRLEVQS